MESHPPAQSCGSGLSLLPFGGLGLDLAVVRRKVRGLLLVPFLKQESPRHERSIDAPAALFGYGLLVRLCRETLGS